MWYPPSITNNFPQEDLFGFFSLLSVLMAEAGGHRGTWLPGEPSALAPSLAGKALAAGGRGEAALHGFALRAAGNTPKWGVDY